MSVIDTVVAEGRYQVVALVDSVKDIGTAVLGCEVAGAEADLPALSRRFDCTRLLVAVGDNYQRQAICLRIRQLLPGVEFATTIHPFSAVSPNAKIGAGVVVMAGVVINAGCTIGDGCLLNTRASIDHGSAMRDFSSLAPGATLGGSVLVGERVSVGLGASISNGVSVGRDSVIGLGSAVTGDIPELVIAFGAPARRARSRLIDEPYL